MAKKNKDGTEKKGFWQEFKEFISRGNILDMAVGVIIGGAFTAIVNALCNNVLRPLINGFLALILGANSLSELFTFIKPVYVTGADGNPTTEIDLTNSIYIDWGAFINAVINFILIALVLFLIIKAVMKLSAIRQQAKESLEAAAEKRKAEKEVAEGSAVAEKVIESAENAPKTEAVDADKAANDNPEKEK